MNRILIGKHAHRASLLWFSCAIVLFAFSWIRVWVGTFFNLSQYSTMLEQLKDFEKYSPIDFQSLLTYPGQVGMVFDEPIVIACIVIWCVARGSDAVSGEIGRGTMEMMLSQPISRRQLLGTHALVSVVGLALLSALVWAGISLGIQTNVVSEQVPAPSFTIPFLEIQIPLQFGEPLVEDVALRDRVPWQVYAAATFHLFAFGFMILAFSTLVSSMDRYRWRTVGLVVGSYVAQVVLYALGMVSESLSWMLGLTFLSCYKPQKMTALASTQDWTAPWSWQTLDPTLALPPIAYPSILIAVGSACFIGAVVVFERRDLPAPL